MLFSSSFFRKAFELIGKAQFEVHLKTQAAEFGCTVLEKMSITRTEILLFLVLLRAISADFQSQKLVMLL